MGLGFHIRQTSQGECQPVCTHCKSIDLRKNGHHSGKQCYVCRACKRSSYGLPPDRRPKCPFCSERKTHVSRMNDGRERYFCSACRRSFLSEYKRARREVTKVRLRHHFTFWLDRHARNKLGEYIQSVRCTDPQAVRAIFRHVLTGKVLWTIRGTSPRSRLLYRVERDPAAAAIRFPNLWRESALQKKKNAGGLYGTGFQPTILGVQRITVMLDDAAKEGLVYAMRFLNLNHADAARWLLTNAQIPEPPNKPPVKMAVALE